MDIYTYPILCNLNFLGDSPSFTDPTPKLARIINMGVVKGLILLLVIFTSFSLSVRAEDLNNSAVQILQTKCMDCHSTQTVFPAYAQLPIIKDLIQNDINNGMSNFNIEEEILSKENSKEISKTTFNKLASVIEAKRMPPIQYKAMHWDKILTPEEEETILKWIQDLRGESISPIPSVESLALNPEEVELGNKLFHDTRLSRDNSISCASCHDLKKGGTDQRRFSIGIGGVEGHINSPTVYNSSFNFRQFWDGRSQDLVTQASGPVHNPIEMGSNWDEVISKLEKDDEYKKAFKEVYGKAMTGDLVAEAIATFERSLLSSGSRFDRYLTGDTAALNSEEKAGYELFLKHSCTNCHLGPSLGGRSFEKMGIKKNYFADRVSGLNGLKAMPLSQEDNGRFNVTKQERDRYKFKVPNLRMISETYPYMHDGNVDSLEESVRIMAEYELGKNLSEKEIQLIAKFLRTL
jgi:cytochrome c peroxidase